jgi:hypothetical protein
MFKDEYTEALFAQAVRDNCQRNFEEDFDNKEPIEYSHDHIVRMEKLIRDDEKREIRTKIFRWTRRCVAAAAAFFVIAAASLITIPEVRAAVIGAIQNRTEHYTEFTGESTDADGEFKQWKLGYIPEGFELDSEIKGKEYYFATYFDDTEKMIYFQYGKIEDVIAVNNEDVDYTQVYDEGVLYHVFTSGDEDHSSALIWDNEVQIFYISGELSIDELLKIAKNIV